MNRMENAFRLQFQEAVSRVGNGTNIGGVSLVGVEQELFLYSVRNGERILANDMQKRKVMDRVPDSTAELGAACIELHPGPVDLAKVGFSGLEEQLADLESQLNVVAAKHGLLVGRCGTVSWAPTAVVETSDYPKYHQVPAFHDSNRRKDAKELMLGGIDVANARIVGLLNAFHFTLQATSVLDALDKLNRLFFISPMAVALFANASRLNGMSTGWKDVRFEVWRRSHDTRASGDVESPIRIGLPEEYYGSIEDYGEDICKFPFILDAPEHALPIGVGLLWRDARLKLEEDKALVEFRPLSTQSTLHQELKAMAFVIGRLVWSQSTNEQLPKMATVRSNKYQAEKYGLFGDYSDGNSNGPMRYMLLEEIKHAASGLRSLNLPDYLGNILLEELLADT